MVGIPRLRTLPPALGIRLRRTRSGVNRPDLTLRRRSDRTASVRGAGTSRGTTPSTPAVRPPLLLRTRSHATTRNAGSYTRLNRSSKRRPGSAAAHRCSFVCITSTRCHAPLTSAGHGTPVFTSVSPPPCSRLPRTRAGPLRHATGSPGPGLLRVLRPPPPAPVGDEPVRPRTAGRRTRAGTGSGAPRAHHVISRRDRHPVMPLHLRRDRAADVGHGLPAGDILRPGSHSGRRCTGGRVRDATQPPSARFRVGGN